MPSHRNEHLSSTVARLGLRALSRSTRSVTDVPSRTGSVSSSMPAAARAAAKYRTFTLISACTWVTSAADRAHRAVGLDEVGIVDAVPRRLGPHRRPPGRLDRVVVRAGAQQASQIGLLLREQAAADLAVGGEPSPVAGAAEGVRHGRDDADGACAAVDLPQLRGSRPTWLGVRR